MRRVAVPIALILIAIAASLGILATRAPSASAAAPGWEIQQITSNAYDDLDPVVGGGLVVWTADPGGTGDRDVFWLRLGEQTIHRVQVAGDDFDVATAQGRIAWVKDSPDPGPDNVSWEIWLLDTTQAGNVPLRLDEAATNAAGPSFAGSRLFWAGAGTATTDIHMYDAATGSPPTNISESLPSGPYYEYSPRADGDLVTWEADMGPGGTAEVVLYNLTTHQFTRITNNTGADFQQAIAGTWVTYYDNQAGEVYLYDAAHPADAPVLLSTGPGFSNRLRISDRGVVFDTFDGSWNVHVHRFDTQALVTLTGSGPAAAGNQPSVGGDLLAWKGSPGTGDGADIYVASFPDLTPVNMSMRPGEDAEPFVGDGMVVWEGTVGGTTEIFFARHVGTGEPTFADVAAGHPYFQAIEGMAAEGIINGYDVGGGMFEFRPGNNLLRAQFAKIIVGAMDLPVTEQTALPPFTDLGPDKPDDLYPHEYVAVAFDNGITYGTTATTFGPYKDITRAQLLSMVVRALQTLRPGSLHMPPAEWTGELPGGDPTHGANVRLAEYNGLLDGVSLSGWDIWAKANRGEAAQILWNVAGMGS